jgi:DNA polymerase III subunit delta'
VILPWHAKAREQLSASRTSGRLPHAILAHQDPATGGEYFARWCAQLVLCREQGPAPCGRCVDCTWVAADQHPDCYAISPIGESKIIGVDQVRDLQTELALTGHSGRGKVALFAPAEAFNAASANALLKTLEEPAPGTLLILVTAQPSRLPATIRSRCLTLRLSGPTRVEAGRWLTEQRGPGNWERALAVTASGPVALLEADPADIERVHREVVATLGALLARTAQPPSVAESWAKSELDLRLACTESWLTDQLDAATGQPGNSTEVRSRTHLPGPGKDLNIRTLIELHRGVRDLRGLLHTSINKAFAVESLLWRWAQVKSK